MRPLLKICGFQTVAEIESIHHLGIDYIGLNFIPGARPLIDVNRAKALINNIDRNISKVVGLFKDQALNEVLDIVGFLDLDLVQLNGVEDQKYNASMPVPILRTIPISPNSDEQFATKYIEEHRSTFYILDRAVQGEGEPVSVSLAGQLVAAFPKQMFLAGGITPENLLEIMQRVVPYGIDISGGVRTNGYIDAMKVSMCQDILRSID
jgi:phosphoribosylanthranilate isomerase